MTTEARAAGGRIDAVYHCTHDWDAGCECRKPRPGMLYAAQRDHHLDLTRTVVVGDDERDAQAAREAGCPFVLVDGKRGLLEVTREILLPAVEVAA
jgi:D-glycero-D-manno-heptose 1,7-bisphosphate phosphatase